MRLLLASTLLFFLSLNGLEIEVSAPSAILINADTGAVLFEKNAEAPHYPASVTKIATALYLIENKGDSLAEVATVSREAVATVSPEQKRKQEYRLPSYWLEFGGSHIGLKKGEEMQLSDLLYGLMLSSGNDAANVIAEHVSGSIPDFMEGVNRRLQELGCSRTHFTNPHGLHHPDHVTCAKDLAIMAQAAMRLPFFQEVVSSTGAERPKTNLQESTRFLQFNKLLRPGTYHYPKAIGVKTGYTSDAGAALVAAAKDEERNLIAVVLGCKSGNARFEDAIALFEAAFNEKKQMMRLLAAGPQPFTQRIENGRGKLTTTLQEDVAVAYYPSEPPKISGQLHWQAGLKAPLQAGTLVGEIEIRDKSGKLLQRSHLLAAKEVPLNFRASCAQLYKESKKLRIALKGTAMAALMIFIGALFRGKRRR